MKKEIKKNWIKREEKNDEQQTIINEHTYSNSKEQSIATQFIPIIHKNKKVNSISINIVRLLRDVFGLYLSQALLRNISHQ